MLITLKKTEDNGRHYISNPIMQQEKIMAAFVSHQIFLILQEMMIKRYDMSQTTYDLTFGGVGLITLVKESTQHDVENKHEKCASELHHF